ncbi:hypothetical protein M8C21_024394 [Ambrosia artemisiifolia]|uniref:Serpin domain-containing protein n=1 Tax=Ambrosia artemisiifolia TaxID=4212 RepID=A0AAD5GB94_AMBAR|nr:hypothetical protein M8C21_024394 [Ambrosia artemisiifolia]
MAASWIPKRQKTLYTLLFLSNIILLAIFNGSLLGLNSKDDSYIFPSQDDLVVIRSLEQSSNQTDVAITLAAHLLSKTHDCNIVFSPLSIRVVLNLIAAGSSGQTLDQLLAFLKANTTDDLNSYSWLVSKILADGGPNGGPRLSFANGVWLDNMLSLKPSFKTVLDTVYKASSKQVNFQNKVSVKY